MSQYQNQPQGQPPLGAQPYQPPPPGYFPPQGPYAPPPRKSRRGLWITLAVVLVAVVVLCSVIGMATSGATNTAATTASNSISAAPTPRPHSTPKAQQRVPTQPAPVIGDPVLGAPIGTFIARFGQPKQMGTDYYSFQNDSIEANFFSDDDTRTFVVSRNAPNDQEFTLQDGKAACAAFLPPDAKYTGKHITQYGTDGSLQDEQYVYVSPSLGKDIPASMFTDEKGNKATPGTIGPVLTYDATIQGNTTKFLGCDDEAGLESS